MGAIQGFVGERAKTWYPVNMNIIFAGTPHFAVPSLEALINSHHNVIAVYTQPDRPAGRGQKLTPSPVKVLAELHGIPVYQPLSLRDMAAQDTLRALAADLMVVVAYGLLLPQAVLDIPRLGCINVHPSLLPRWRGAAPIQRTILAGDKHTGVATMQLDAGMDTGPILLLEKAEVLPLETSGQLQDRLALTGARLLLQTVDGLQADTLVARPQSDIGVTHAAKITKAEAQLDWHLSAMELQHRVGGYNPAPIAHTTYNNQVLRVWQAMCLSEEAVDALPGNIIQASKAGIDVATGKGVLRLLQVQLPGGKPMTVAEFLNKDPMLQGTWLGKINV